MSTTISGRGKQRKHGQDLNSNQNSMGGGHSAMPPNGVAPAAFVTPTVPVTHPIHPQEYPPRSYGGAGLEYTPASGHQHPSMTLPPGANLQHEQTSTYAMQGVPQNMQQQRPQGMQQWQGVPQQQPHQQHMMQQHTGMVPTMNRVPVPQQNRGYAQQPPQQVAFYPNGQAGYYVAPTMYPQPQYTPPEAYAAAQQAYVQQQQLQQQQLQQQQFYQNAMQQQHQGAMQPAQPSMQQQQGGGASGGVGAGAQMGGGAPPTQQQQQQPVHGGVQPASGPPMHQGPAPVPAPTNATIPNFVPSMQQQQLQRTPPAPVLPKKRNVLQIVDPTTNQVVNQNDVEASKREEDAPKAEKEEAKGTDEMDSAAPEVKKQFAEAILEKTTPKPEKPAPTPPSVAPAKQQNKCLFSPEQLALVGLKDKVPHVATPPVPAAAPAPAPVAAAAPAAEEEEEPAKQATPEVTPAEMPAETNNDEQADESQLAETSVHEEPASSSSEKNASNDSAICVQSPVTLPTPTAQEEEKVVVAVEEPLAPVVADEEPAVEEKQEQQQQEEEKEVVEEPTPVEEPLHKKLEQLVIAESASQEEAESEPSTPAPVTPSVSETAAALAEEEEEDAEKAEAAREEVRQLRRAELEAEIAKNKEDIEQFNEELCRYNREYLYNVRDLEKDFHVTPCPLTPDELKGFGICRSLVSNEPKRKQDGQGSFMPGWARSGGGPRGGGPKAYQGRQSEQHQRGGGNKHGPNRKLPPSIRPSIERRVETNVLLHKAEVAWKPEKVTETDPALEGDEEKKNEIKKKLLLKTIRALFNKITPTTKDALINEFLVHKVYESPALNDVISVIFDKAVEEPKFCPLYSSMCFTQVSEELKLNNNSVSHFRNAILFRAQETFTTKNLDEFVAEKQAEIEAETDEKKKKEKQIELLEAQVKFRRRKFGNITFIGQLYLQNLISVRIILFCVVDLLKSVTPRDPKPANQPANLDGYEADEDAVDCAVRLLETIGKRLQSEANAQAAAAAAAKQPVTKITRNAPVQQQQQQKPQQAFPIDMTFQTLEGAIPIVSSRIKFMIMNLCELRKNGWVPRKGQDAGPKKLDEIKKDIQKEQMENQQAAMQYERKQSRQEPMGGRGMGGGGGYGGGHGGGHGGNPKRQVIQRNSTDRGNPEDRRAQAHKTSSMAQTKAPPKKGMTLSSVTASAEKSLGGGKKQWSTGASGGSENSKKEDRAAALQQTSRFLQQRSSSAASMKEDEGASASGTATQVNSEDEREQNEKREKQEGEITKRVVCDVGDYCDGEIKLEEVRDEIFKYSENEEKYGKLSLQTTFKCFMAAAVKKATKAPEMAAKFGHVLAFCLRKKTWTDEETEKVPEKDRKAVEEKENKQRDEILKGVADSCREVVEQEQWEDAPKIWDIFAEVLINAHMPEEGLYEGGHPTLADFKDAFLNAAKDTRKQYTLFVLVLKRLAELHHKRDQDGAMEIMTWVMGECDIIVKKMDTKKLNKALEETTTNFDENLHKIMNQH